MSIQDNIRHIRASIPDHVRLVAVSKTKPVSDIMKAYDAGQRVFGENKAQEMIGKHPELPGDIAWHFIGHLQSNKVKFMVPFVHMIESVDSFKLLKEINKQAAKVERRIDCLLQFHIASEDTKFGLDMDEAVQIIKSDEFAQMQNIRICGVMGMATFTDNEEVLREEFSRLRKYFHVMKDQYFSGADEFKEISMGMSGDFQLAIEEGSTIVRIGTGIFGARSRGSA
ncbi:MAG: YggS family pyridoxal phosphate-dependent enzyme [Bacteroidetes bacterium]|nr:YggS family pyridoxal phosphate-dependent enzyme [Bacteroidota bacterium]